jgi:hypothetical protein
MPIVCFQYMYGLKPVPFSEQRRTSGAKALIIPAIYGTAEAVPFVQSCFAVGREHSGVERSAVSFRFSQTLCYKTPSLQTCMPQRVQRVCENRKRNSSGENSSTSKGIIAASPIPAKAVSCGPQTCFTSGSSSSDVLAVAKAPLEEGEKFVHRSKPLAFARVDFFH